MKKITINILASKENLDRLMRCADLFEHNKRLVEILSIDYELEKSEPDLAFITRFKNNLEKGGYIVTALWIAQLPEISYVDWSVKVISTGDNWSLLEDYMKQFNIQKMKK